jgi:hypothetical protein
MIIKEAFGPSWKSQPPQTYFSIPMKNTGNMYAALLLACAIPIDDNALAQVVKEHGFKFCSILMSCMHLTLWTRLDLFTTCAVLAQ